MAGALTKIFAGGKMRRGCRPNKSHRGSGSVARHALKQLEQMGLVEKASNGYVCPNQIRSDQIPTLPFVGCLLHL
jgi:ribosomal protein S19E (S16A)